MATTRVLALSLSVLLFMFVVDLVRREKLTFKYAAGWLVASVIAIFFSLFDRCLFSLAKAFGFQLASNFVFFALLGIFVLLSLLLTVFLYQQDKRNGIIAQKMAKLEHELIELRKKDRAAS